MIADVWYAEVTPGAANTLKPGGTWPYMYSWSAGSSIGTADSLFIPTWAFHGTGRQFSGAKTAVQTSRSPSAERFSVGLTNAGFLDGHAASVRRWKGTANPSFD
jgi:prepilin-type processing-associated H-X9-DG protein